MKKTLALALIFNFSIVTAHSNQAGSIQQAPANKETLAAKVEKFKKENPHTLNIVMGFLKHGWSKAFEAYFPDMRIMHHLCPESSNYRFETQVYVNLPRTLEAENESTTQNRLINILEKKQVIDGEYKAIDACTKCAVYKAGFMQTYHCISYVPKDVFEVTKREVAAEKASTLARWFGWY
jgi:hypothetical protein